MGHMPPKRKPLPSSAKNEPTGKTESHRLSNEEQDGLVVAKPPDDPAAVVDLGWCRPSAQFEESLVAGLSNEDLWMLMRRFDKVSVYTNLVGLELKANVSSKSTMSKPSQTLHPKIWT